MKRQRGLSLIGLIIVAGVLVFVAIIGFKMLPAYIEYFTIKKVLMDLTHQADLRGASIKDVQNAFEKRRQIDNIESVTGQDLEITKQGETGFSIIASYTVRVPLFSNISACVDFEVKN
jgi:Tfp pilus assembly major pilin PilA